MSETTMTIARLEQSELFCHLDRTLFNAIIASASVWPVPRGATLLKQGDEPAHLFLVREGQFKMTVLNENGAQLTLRFMQPGDVIGCAAVFRHIPYPATATAMCDSSVLAWTAAKFGQLLRVHPPLATNALAMVGGRAEEMLRRLSEALKKAPNKELPGPWFVLHGKTARSLGRTRRLSSFHGRNWRNLATSRCSRRAGSSPLGRERAS